jgi:uncharacterized protein (TIGR03435 family)
MRWKGLGIAIAMTAVALSQDAPRFEVASVKPSGPKSERGSEGGPGSSDPGRYRYTSATLDDLIATGYHVDYFQISSKTPLDRDRFDVVAKLPEGATKEQFRLMLRDLLAERFHLKAHIESKEFPGYELAVAKSGSKLNDAPQPSGDDDRFPALPPNRPGMTSRYTTVGGVTLVRMRARQQTMAALAHGLRAPGERPVVDGTGLTGTYDFTLEYTMDLPGSAPAADAPTAPTLFGALQQQLGLQLIAKKLPFDVVIVDSVDKLPTEN